MLDTLCHSYVLSVIEHLSTSSLALVCSPAHTGQSLLRLSFAPWQSLVCVSGLETCAFHLLRRAARPCHPALRRPCLAPSRRRSSFCEQGFVLHWPTRCRWHSTLSAASQVAASSEIQRRAHLGLSSLDRQRCCWPSAQQLQSPLAGKPSWRMQ